MRVVAPLAALLLVATACSGTGESPSPSPSASAEATGEAFVAPELVTVDPSIVAGIDVQVAESLEVGSYTYVAVPTFPNGADLTQALRDAIQLRIEAFQQYEVPDDADVKPELTVSWSLVGSSPDVLGVRLVSAEVGGDTFDGSSRTVWLDLATREARPVADLVEPEAIAELLDRIIAAGEEDPRVDNQRLYDQMDGELEAFDSVAFTPDGNLWVEFDRAQVASSVTPVGIEVEAEGLLSDFGEAARTAALEPSDPDVQPPPSPTPTATAPVTAPTGASSRQTQTLGDDTDCSVEQCIALTFDDGPVAGTADLLDLLADRGVKATFFMVGQNVAANPALVQRMADEGHALGNHSWDHPQLTRLDADGIREELESTSNAIEAAAGVAPALVRPPYGATDDAVAAVAAELGLSQILWDVDPEDWKDKDAGIVHERVVAAAHRNAIILSHDIHETTRAAYAAIIDDLIAAGYTLVTVPDLIDDLEPGGRYFNGD
ncbi:polysaccharide deacetylase family protein [Demequina sp. SYSU T00192]|uniref:Polysaccharide deacetylase family protein n=1 Tax=Demequina litoralis TaxID=3051660 RepID=A0ABT8G908_9MICO|nr:polysaccharide deacetylase family protein [Demequina sp. SYSU T00192]MDN4475611.1 polysaccharide deacetylase family protein [Demequina sp. SYSU T00192]